MMGRLMIKVLFNFSEILRILRKSGWNIEDALDFKSEDEIKALYGKDVKDISFLKVRKGPLSIDVPPSLIARMKYELLSPSSVIERFEEIYKRGPQKDFDYCLPNYTEEQKIWN